MARPRFAPWLATLVVASAAAPAAAQSATALDRLEPAPAGDALLATPAPSVAGEARPAAALLFSYAHDPLVVADANGEVVGDVVSHQLLIHSLLSLGLLHRAVVDVDVPVIASQSGDGPRGLPSPTEATVADVRVGVRVELLPQRGGWPAAAAALSAWLPTGNDHGYAGASSLRFAPGLVVGSTYRRALWSIAVSRRFQEGGGTVGTLLGSEVWAGIGVAARLGALTVGPEVWASTVAEAGTAAFARRTTNAEALLGGQLALGPLTVALAAGPGLVHGAGTPDYRLVGRVGYAVDASAPSSSAQDGARSAGAGGGALAGRAGGAVGAPVADRDGDGVSDGDDACPDVVGDATPTAKRRGCPPDRDGDGVPDRFDRCPDRRGVDAVDPDKRGCPADGDGDGIPDEEDACPADKGIATGDRATHGCPKSVRFEGKQIVILEQIHFATGRDVIEADSSGVLDQVAQVMRDHPDLARVAVEGHTDDEGAEQANLALSQRRAVAVVRALVSRGIDARRLEARGYGPRRAITDNKTPEGRAKNRRVEFLVVLRTDRGEAGWRDGPVDDAPRGAP